MRGTAGIVEDRLRHPPLDGRQVRQQRTNGDEDTDVHPGLAWLGPGLAWLGARGVPPGAKATLPGPWLTRPGTEPASFDGASGRPGERGPLRLRRG